MSFPRSILVLLIFFAVIFSAKSQVVGFRFGLNTGLFFTELGDTDVPHPDLFPQPSLSSEKFTPQATIGFEGEILFQVSPMSHFGIELDYSKLKGYNNNPPLYNYYLTPYYSQFQDFYTTDAVAFNTTMFNVAVNWKYFFFKTSPLKPFVKLTGVVSYVGTDFTFKDNPDPEIFDSDVLYARGTSNTDQKMWPAFHVGGGIGFDYKINDHWSLQVDGTSTVVNSDIINGAPNFTYLEEDGKDMLKYNKRPSLTLQISAGLVYYIEVLGQSDKGGQGKTGSGLPFFRRK